MCYFFQDQSIPEKTLLGKRPADESFDYGPNSSERSRNTIADESFNFGPNNSKRSRNARLMAGAHYLPKKREGKPLGEDAYFICDEENTIGVADGVGGLTGRGIDSGAYARELMDKAHDFALDESVNGVDPMRVLNYAYSNNSERGASTACIITLKDNALHAVNIGDSGFLVIRKNEIVYRSMVQTSQFNFPYQLGLFSPFTPRNADEIVFDVEHGDVVVAATDGLFDNLFNEEIEVIVSNSILLGEPLNVVAANLVEEARKVSLCNDCVTPFTVAAVDHGLDKDMHTGGKYDDVTAVVGFIY